MADPVEESRTAAPPPSVRVQLVAIVVIFFGGAPLGMALAHLVAPESMAARFIAFFSLPTSLIVGFYLWLGTAVVLLIPRLLRALARREWPRGTEPSAADAHFVPPGHGAFVVTGGVCGGAAGLIVALLPATVGRLGAVAAFTAAGLGYGLVARTLAARGLLPFPDEF